MNITIIKKYLSPAVARWMLIMFKSLGVSIASIAVIAYLSGKIRIASAEISRSRNTLAAFNRKYEFFDRLKTDYARVAPAIGKLESAIPLVDNFPAIADYINSVIIKTANIAVPRFDPLPKLNEAGLMELSFSLRAAGNFQTIQNLLKEFETAPYFIKIQGVTLSFANGVSGQTEADLNGVIYLKNEPL